ncbi:shikimate dehydrogenase [Sediminibacillus albus]|uniref:Shikimate dehydrogenase (NADP(+)) n=1 Tax=Sediminibacillus albus TaxID=407036 RepID=A0A1G9CMF5_9BACI|nr:shikimate dehydrogenase [Sediminibacillus albus]SDK52798.1 shikimate dehydrogenase [Sediminibacillus albus]
MNYQFGLIGYPVNHSLSPWIHQQFMSAVGLEGAYLLFETPVEKLDERLKQLKQDQIHGFNVTVPYKQKVMAFLDEVDADADRIGAVNTVVNQGGRWKGYNTDGIGYIRSLRKEFPDLFSSEKRVLILGAGGAARGIYRVLVNAGFQKVDIANRTKEKAEGLLDLQEVHTETAIYGYKEAEDTLDKYDLIVQTTSVGMSPDKGKQIISLKKLHPHTVVSDIIYNPLTTQLLQEASDQGARVHRGHTMLLYQARYAFEIWTGTQPAMNGIVSQLEKRLRGI